MAIQTHRVPGQPSEKQQCVKRLSTQAWIIYLMVHGERNRRESVWIHYILPGQTMDTRDIFLVCI